MTMANDVSRLRRQKTRSRSRETRGESAKTRFKDSFTLARIYQVGCGLGCLWLLAPPLRPPYGALGVRVGALALVVCLVLLSLRLLLGMSAPAVFARNSRVLLVSLMVFGGVGGARGVLEISRIWTMLPDPDLAIFLTPYTFVPVVLTLLLGAGVSLATGVAIAILSAWIWQGCPVVFLLGVVTTVVVTQLVANAHRRSRVLKGVLAAGMVQFAGVFLMMSHSPSGLIDDPRLALVMAGSALAGALSGGLLALLVLPVIEHVFALTSNITLNGFADLGHPLLQRLALQAPGSYHHSLVVANLARAAAEEIGANPLLARVASYYHDIGKLEKPNFFIENALHAKNPHDDLPANISRMIIANHVKEGISLGLLHKLPPPIMEVIREHHGTSLIRCFHHKAQAESRHHQDANGETAPNADRSESHYRYGGPTPASKASGIVCLADAIEAASRALERVSPAHIDGLVSDIIAKKILDDQLCNSALTLSDVTRIKRAFVATLGSILHARIAYPNHEDNALQSPKPIPNQSG